MVGGITGEIEDRSARAALMAASTSRAAPSISRLMSNCSVIMVCSNALCEVISVTSAIRPRWRSSGAATLVATVLALAPGSCAVTTMVGRSILGSGATGNLEKPRTPASAQQHQQRSCHRPRDEWRRNVHLFVRAGVTE